ncbi:hypothetical protein Bbelb_349560 [Branchiostoma belcheri]|nr:hypothetical protein Bbelb_349560 [Branchiostoma belcheri]
MHSPVVLQPNTTAPEPPAQKQPALVGLYNCVLQYKPRKSGLFNRKSSQLAGRCDLTDIRSRGGEGGTPAPDGTETGTHAIFNAFGHVQIALQSKLPKKATQETEVTAAASRQQVVPKPPVPTYNQPPFVQRVSMATEAAGPQTSMQPTNPNVTIVQPPTQARRNTVKDLIGAQRAGPPQPQVATAPKPPPPQPVAQQQVGSGQRATPTAPPTRQKPPEKARVPSQDTANVNAVIDLTEDAEETTNSQASGRKPSGAGPPPLLKAVVEPSPPPNTVAPAAQARPTSQVCPFNNPQQAAPAAVSVNTSRNIFEVLQAIMNSARTIQAPPNFRTVTTSVQQVGQSLHTLPSTAPTYRRPPLQTLGPTLARLDILISLPRSGDESSVGYVGGQPVVPHVQQRTGTFRPPDVTTSTYVVQPSRVVENTLSPAMCMRPSQPGNPLYNHYSQPQRHPVHSVGVPPARHPMPQTMTPYRQPFQQVRPPASMMQAPRPTGPPIMKSEKWIVGCPHPQNLVVLAIVSLLVMQMLTYIPIRSFELPDSD